MTVLIIGLLSADAISFGQASDSTHIQPNVDDANNFAEASVSYFSEGTGEHVALAGAGLSIGWRVSPAVKFKLESGFYSASKTMGAYYSSSVGNYVWRDTKVGITVIPVLFSASFSIPMDANGRDELRFTPSLGFCNVSQTGHISYYYYNDDYGYSSTPLAYGFGIGYTCHFNKQFYVDIGIRWLSWSGSGLAYTTASVGFTLAGGLKF